VERLTRSCLAWPRATAVALLLVSALALAGMLRLRTDTGFRAYLGAGHPVVQELDAFLEGFGGGFPVAAVWSCEDTPRCESVFDPASLAMAAAVTRALERVDGVRRVASPATSALWVPAEDGFDVRRLTVDGGEPSPDLAVLAARARIDPLWVGTLVSSDGTTGAILLELASTGSATSIAVIHALRAALAPFEAEGFRFHLVGQAVELLVTDEELAADSARLVPATVLIIGLTVFAVLRSWQCVVAALASVGLALVWALGAMGWLGWPQNAIGQTLALVLLVVGIAEAIHLLAAWSAERRRRPGASRAERTEVIASVVRDVGPACVMTSITTSAGFLSFATSGAESFVRFGVVAAIGISAALILSFTLLPLLLLALPADRVRPEAAAGPWEGVLDGAVALAVKRAPLVLAGTLLLTALGALGFSRLRVEVDAYELYGPESRVVRWARFVEERLRPPDSLELALTAPAGDTLESPGRLAELARLSSFLPSVEGLGRTRSVLDPLARLNRLLHDDAPEQEQLTETPEATAELLLLLSVQGGNALDPWLSLDHSRVRFSVEAAKMNQAGRARVLAEVRAFLARELPGWGPVLTGPLAVYYEMVEEIHRTQLWSLGTAFLTVLVLVSLCLRSPRFGLVAMVPAIVPVLVTLGTMGFWGLSLDMGTAMVAAVMLGIAGDETIHLLDQFRRRRLQGASPAAAVEGAMRHVARAVVTTCLALSLGFFTMVLSSWQSIASFGLLSGVAILASLVATLFAVPALLVALPALTPPVRRPR
jgi:hypothetical protein